MSNEDLDDIRLFLLLKVAGFPRMNLSLSHVKENDEAEQQELGTRGKPSRKSWDW